MEIAFEICGESFWFSDIASEGMCSVGVAKDKILRF